MAVKSNVMRINIKQAIKLFFANPSFDMVFTEAVANSLDAGASKIDIKISIEELAKQETLIIKIIDNGVGFTDERYKKFCELLKTDDTNHKGVGRLVYLYYFDEIEISSKYGEKYRNFLFNANFDADNSNMKVEDLDIASQETILTFRSCSLKRLSSYDAIRPNTIKKKIMQEFLPKLYLYREEGKKLDIKISLVVSKTTKNQLLGNNHAEINLSELPTLKTEPIDISQIELFREAKIHYYISKKEIPSSSFVITALCIDDRAHNLSDIISLENIPKGYELIFLLKSSFFDGKVDPSRQVITLNDETLKWTKKLFRNKIAEIVQKEIPVFREKNEKTMQSLQKTYPHLLGYFDEDEIGLISRGQSLENAQQKFIRDQKMILEAESLDEKKYNKALEMSSRSLAEYILYREKIIGRLESITKKDSEAKIHDLILPRKSIIKASKHVNDIYNNNLWLFDNKYMTYSKALSDRAITEILEEITQESTDKDDTRPDIAIIFSDNPDMNLCVDVVIIELKKRGITLAKTEEVISQLRQRAIKLLKYYPNKIQRIWFYGIVEFNDEFKLSLKNDHYAPLFSKDSLYYKENEWYLDLNSPIPYKVGTYILSIDAFIQDAKAQNYTFLEILKTGFRNIDS